MKRKEGSGRRQIGLLKELKELENTQKTAVDLNARRDFDSKIQELKSRIKDQELRDEYFKRDWSEKEVGSVGFSQ